MSEVNKEVVENNEDKSLVETFKLRGRNHYDVVSQLVSTYNTSNGWSIVKVVGNAISLDVYLERSAKQSKEGVSDEKKVEAPKKQEVVVNEEKTTITGKPTEGKPSTKTSTVKKATK